MKSDINYLSKGIFVELNQNHAHIIASKLLFLRIACQKSIEQIFECLLRGLSTQPFLSDEANQLLPIFLISFPNSIAPHQNKVIIFAQLNSLDIWMSGYSLPFIGDIRILFIVLVSEAARKIKVVINTSTFYFKSRCDYSLELYRSFWLMVIGHLNDRPHSTQRSARISCICHIKSFTYEQCDICSASYRVSNFTIFKWLQSVFNCDISE